MISGVAAESEPFRHGKAEPVGIGALAGASLTVMCRYEYGCIGLGDMNAP
jgi:hypothetical protein